MKQMYNSTDTPYEALGLRTNNSCRVFTTEEIKAAYKDKIKTAHPDRGGSEEWFCHVQNAYETLKTNPNATRIVTGSETAQSTQGTDFSRKNKFYNHPHNKEWQRRQWEQEQEEKRRHQTREREKTRYRYQDDINAPFLKKVCRRFVWMISMGRFYSKVKMEERGYYDYGRAWFFVKCGILVFLVYKACSIHSATLQRHIDAREQGYPASYWEEEDSRAGGVTAQSTLAYKHSLATLPVMRSPHNRVPPPAEVADGNMIRDGKKVQILRPASGTLPTIGSESQRMAQEKYIQVHTDKDHTYLMKAKDYHAMETFSNGRAERGAAGTARRYNGYEFSMEGLAAQRRARKMLKAGGKQERKIQNGVILTENELHKLSESSAEQVLKSSSQVSEEDECEYCDDS